MIVRIYDELRDSLALAIAIVTAVAVWQMGAHPGESVAVAGVVIGTRLVAGLLLPRDPWIAPLSTLTLDELAIARRIARDVPEDAIAKELRLTKYTVAKMKRRILEKLHFRDPWEIRGWLITLGDMPMPERPSGIRRFLESTAVRALITAGGFLALVNRLQQIWIDNCARLLGLWPNLPCPPGQ